VYNSKFDVEGSERKTDRIRLQTKQSVLPSDRLFYLQER
jgi:hypothetical protein